jgi:hypothetical protein
MIGHGRNRSVNINVSSSVVTLYWIERTLKAQKIRLKLLNLTMLCCMALEHDLPIAVFILFT